MIILLARLITGPKQRSLSSRYHDIIGSLDKDTAFQYEFHCIYPIVAPMQHLALSNLHFPHNSYILPELSHNSLIDSGRSALQTSLK